MNDLKTETELELNISRLVDLPPGLLFRCWTEPGLMLKWFTPRPWTTASCEVDLRVGGVCTVVMRNPEGQEFPNSGVYLEIVPGRRLVFTDAFQANWIPAPQPFMTAKLSFEKEAGKTRYTARAFHWTAAGRDKHIEMGFHSGWNTCLDQLLEVAAQL